MKVCKSLSLPLLKTTLIYKHRQQSPWCKDYNTGLQKSCQHAGPQGRQSPLAPYNLLLCKMILFSCNTNGLLLHAIVTT